MSAPPESVPAEIGGFQVEREIGQGGTSRVLLARHPALDRRVALKVFRFADGDAARPLERLRREARLLARLDHENVVRCFDFGQHDGLFFLVLEYVEGESLKKRVDREGPLAARAAAGIAIAVARGLEHAHARGVVHRDVKPGNVLLAADGRIKLSDFGLARTGEDLELTQPGTTVGTPQYLSPEQARDPRRADARSDVYSLGATLYHMLTGRPPHQGDSLAQVVTRILFSPVRPPEELVPGLPPALSRIVARAMARDRALRYPGPAALRRDLETWLQSAAPGNGLGWDEAGAPPPSPPGVRSPERGPGARRAVPVVAATALGVAALGAGAWFLVLADRGGGDKERARVAAPDVAPPPSSASLAQKLEDLGAGSLKPAEAYEAAARLPSVAEGDLLRAAAEQEAAQRAPRLAESAAAAARQGIAAGRLGQAAAAFDAELERQSVVSLGRPAADLPAPLAARLAEVADLPRATVAELDAAAAAAVEQTLHRALGEVEAEVKEALAARLFAAARTAVEDWRQRGDDLFLAALEGGIRHVLGGEEAAPRLAQAPPAWREAARVRAAEHFDRLAARVEAEIEGVRALALRAVADHEPGPGQEPAAVAAALEAAAEAALGAPRAAFPDPGGVLAAALAARAEELAREHAERELRRRREAEMEALPAVEVALERQDYAAARAAIATLGAAPDAIVDEWLALLAGTLPRLAELRGRALAAFAAEAGGKVELRTRDGILREGVLGRVDAAQGELVFDVPPSRVPIEQVEAEEILARVAVAPGDATAFVLLLADDELDAAGARLAAAGDVPWRDVATVALARSRDQARRRVEDREREAQDLLATFDEAAARAVPAERLHAAERILDDPGLRRLDSVRPRLRELLRTAEEDRRAIARERRREALVHATAAVITFDPAGQPPGTIEVRYAFASPREAEDFRLPGPEWRVDDGRLTALRAGEAPATDLYHARPGVVRSLEFDPTRPADVGFDVEFPYEAAPPELFGLRIFSTCFAVRSPGEAEFAGQVNAWSGDLDDVEDHLYRPWLGETRPRRRSAGPVRDFAFERGARYRVELEWRPGSDGDCTLLVDGAAVYRFRLQEPARRAELELRSATPFVLDDLVLCGVAQETEPAPR